MRAVCSLIPPGGLPDSNPVQYPGRPDHVEDLALEQSEETRLDPGSARAVAKGGMTDAGLGVAGARCIKAKRRSITVRPRDQFEAFRRPGLGRSRPGTGPN